MDKKYKLSPSELKLAQEAGINPLFEKLVTPRERNLLRITTKYHKKYTMETEINNKHMTTLQKTLRLILISENIFHHVVSWR